MMAASVRPPVKMTAAMRKLQEHAIAVDDHFDSEDTPDTTDSFIQTDKRESSGLKQPDDDYEYGDREMAVSQGDSSDFSIHQFLTQDDGREGTPVSDDDFNSEDTPDNSDNFVQLSKTPAA